MKNCTLCNKQFSHKGTKCNACVCKLGYQKNREKRLAKAKEYREANLEKIKKYQRNEENKKRKRERRKNDPARFERGRIEYRNNREQRILSQKKYRNKNLEKISLSQKFVRSKKEYKERRRNLYKINFNGCADRSRERCKKYSISNKEKIANRNAEYRKKSEVIDRIYRNDVLSGKRKERLTQRRSAIKKATPKWLSRKLLVEIYRDCPAGFHVDHIIPLQGESVCGLHVPWNLQYLPAKENLRKGNKV